VNDKAKSTEGREGVRGTVFEERDKKHAAELQKNWTQKKGVKKGGEGNPSPKNSRKHQLEAFAIKRKRDFQD